MKSRFLILIFGLVILSACSEDTKVTKNPDALQSDITLEQPKVSNSDNLPPVPPKID